MARAAFDIADAPEILQNDLEFSGASEAQLAIFYTYLPALFFRSMQSDLTPIQLSAQDIAEGSARWTRLPAAAGYAARAKEVWKTRLSTKKTDLLSGFVDRWRKAEFDLQKMLVPSTDVETKATDKARRLAASVRMPQADLLPEYDAAAQAAFFATSSRAMVMDLPGADHFMGADMGQLERTEYRNNHTESGHLTPGRQAVLRLDEHKHSSAPGVALIIEGAHEYSNFKKMQALAQTAGAHLGCSTVLNRRYPPLGGMAIWLESLGEDNKEASEFRRLLTAIDTNRVKVVCTAALASKAEHERITAANVDHLKVPARTERGESLSIRVLVEQERRSRDRVADDIVRDGLTALPDGCHATAAGSADLMMYDMSAAETLGGFDIEKPLAQRADKELAMHELLLRLALAELELAFESAVRILLKYTVEDQAVHLYWLSMITRVPRAEALKLDVDIHGVDSVNFSAMASNIMPNSGALKAQVTAMVKTPARAKRGAAAATEQGLSKRAKKAARDRAAAGKQGGSKEKGALGGKGGKGGAPAKAKVQDKDKVCHGFEKGDCRYGEGCKFSHAQGQYGGGAQSSARAPQDSTARTLSFTGSTAPGPEIWTVGTVRFDKLKAQAACGKLKISEFKAWLAGKSDQELVPHFGTKGSASWQPIKRH